MKVLLIEDDPDLGTTLKQALASLYEMSWCLNCQSCLQEIATKSFDCFIIDLELPDGDGISLCKQIRLRYPIVPIIFLTAHQDMPSILSAFNAGADDFIAKPYHLAELEARLHSVLRRPLHVQAEILSIADLTLNPTERIVKRGTTVITVRRKQFDLLEYFMRHPCQVLSRAVLLNALWDESADPFSNVIDVHVKYLRDCIDRPFAHKLIHTVTGIDYKICP